ncbi:cytochrome-c peroxidase [Olivibacter sp. SDN3]|uniref:cytochrome-c peroxidase n=1 Tax=Olivibacter sp. SDN3 TaxID=2764720 RepID=UPI0016514580|nr:cytochrome c peroxidase [Olivibacter sp. SDN3]QNL49051.1 cytochrome-c peroxidase [Olivibacter sp. SDN3]
MKSLFTVLKRIYGCKTGVLTLLVSCSFLLESAFQINLIQEENERFVLSYPSYFGNKIYENAGNPLTKNGVALGRMLFYEKALSANNNISCGTCHRQELSFTNGERFSEGTDGTLTDRNAMALVNLLWVNNFFWDGRAQGLENQVVIPLTDAREMGQPLDISTQKLQEMPIYPPMFKAAFGTEKITDKQIIYALAQFTRTLISENSKYDQYLQGNYQPSAAELRGIALFFGHEERGDMRRVASGHCHGGPKTFTELYHNNGLDAVAQDVGRAAFTGLAADTARFRVATLRNIALTAPYMHDGRFETLEEVLDHYSEHIKASPTLSPFLRNTSGEQDVYGLQFKKEEKEDIIRFLNLLTDTTFISNPLFSDPFINK